MARYRFGQSPSDWTFVEGPNSEAILAGSVSLTFWNASVGGSQYTDLLLEETPVTSITTGDGVAFPTGTIPEFQGPDGIPAMWADAGTGTRYYMVTTDVGEGLDDLGLRVESAENILANVQALTDSMAIVVFYDEGTASWPARPAIAGSRVVYWHGPNGNPPPAESLQTNDQFFGWAG